MTSVFSLFRSLLAGLVILLAIGVEAEHPSQRSGGDGRGAEVRGLWVVRTSLASPASIAEMVRTAADAGINALFVQVRGRGDAYYRSSLEPRGVLLARRPLSFDSLAAVIREARPRGIAVHAWINVGLVSDAVNLTRAPEHIIRAHPEWLMLPRELAASASRHKPRDPRYLNALAQWTRANTAHVEGLYVSPIPREARVHAAAVAREVAHRYDIDGMHLDYVRYPHDAFDYSPLALAEFRASLVADLASSELAALDARAGASPAVFTDRFPERWEAFRRARVTALVAGMADAARKARPGIIISAAVLPDPDAAVRDKLQDWPAWAAQRLVDAICPMAYAEDRAAFTKQVQATYRAAGGLPVWTGIGAYRLAAAETASRIREARKTGSAGIVLFSYDSVSSGPQRRRYLTDVARAAFTP